MIDLLNDGTLSVLEDEDIKHIVAADPLYGESKDMERTQFELCLDFVIRANVAVGRVANAVTTAFSSYVLYILCGPL